METVKSSSSSSSPNLYKLLRAFSKILRLKTRQNKTPKLKFHQNVKDTSNPNFGVPSNQLLEEENEKLRYKKGLEGLEALLAKLFASISTIKASYAQLQIAQSPYDPEEIQLADELVVTELKYLSELKQSLLKKQVDESPQVSILLAMVKEQKSVLKSYEITGKKFDSQFKLKDSEILFLKEKLEESDKQNEVLEQQLDPVGSVSVFDNLQLSELNAKHFMILLRDGIKSIRSFVKLIISEMSSAGWDLVAAAESIEPGIVYGKLNERYLALESFVCRKMFEGFQYPSFCTELVHEKQQQQGREQCRRFFDDFMELRFTNAMEILKVKPGCSFGKFCRMKYLGLVHPKMELAFFGDLNHRNVVNSGGYPETHFFSVFVEMAKHIWLLYSLAYSFDPAVTIFQVERGSRFSEVFMENVVEEDMDDPPVIDPRVGFTVVPGFKIGNTVIQCQVYLSSGLNHGE